jgi:hypothetical protein
MGANLDAIRAAIVQAKVVAEEFQTGTAKFYEDNNPTPIVTTTCRVRKPKPSTFDAGNESMWATKREMIIKVPLLGTEAIRKGFIVQVSTPDGDPLISLVNFVVQSAFGSQFTAERAVVVVSEIIQTPRIV